MGETNKIKGTKNNKNLFNTIIGKAILGIVTIIVASIIIKEIDYKKSDPIDFTGECKEFQLPEVMQTKEFTVNGDYKVFWTYSIVNNGKKDIKDVTLELIKDVYYEYKIFKKGKKIPTESDTSGYSDKQIVHLKNIGRGDIARICCWSKDDYYGDENRSEISINYTIGGDDGSVNIDFKDRVSYCWDWFRYKLVVGFILIILLFFLCAQRKKLRSQIRNKDFQHTKNIQVKEGQEL